MKRLTCVSLLLMACVGCGGSGSNSTANNQTAATSNSSNVAQGGSGVAPVITSGAGTEPGEVVALFLDSLRRGDENAANGVLTAQAQAELTKTDYVIQPLGTPEGNYKIGRVGFVDGDTSVALVECLWTEPSPQAGQPPLQLDIVCEVHKETQGWRISGLAVKMAGTEETLVLDFEDASSLQAALQEAGDKPAAPSTPAAPGGVAAQPGLPAAGGTQLPSLQMPAPGQPALPNSLAQPTQPGVPTQLGVPSLPGQPALPAGIQMPTNPSLPGSVAVPGNPAAPAGAAGTPAAQIALPQLPPSGQINR